MFLIVCHVYTRRFSLCRIGVLVLFLAGPAAVSSAQSCLLTDHYVPSLETPFAAGSQLITMVAFGTSVMWGNGLRPRDTFRSQVAFWISSQTGRPVQVETFAHSAALLRTGAVASNPDTDIAAIPKPPIDIGAINTPLPSVDQQIDCASSVKNLSNADFILMEGCINDVGAEEVVYPWTDTEQLVRATDENCGPQMQGELEKISRLFPHAIVVVVGYYPLVSSRSLIFGFSSTRRLAKHATKVHKGRRPEARKEPRPSHSRQQEHDIMVKNSEEFYQHSKSAIKDAIKAVNNIAGQPRFFFANLPEIKNGNGISTVDPLFAYGAPQKHEWMVPFRFLFFWAFYKDEEYWRRQSLCKKYVNDVIERFVCDSNPAFHPNVQGAKTYAESIEAVIPSSVLASWKAGAKDVEGQVAGKY